MTRDKTGSKVVFEARKWLGTPYQHQASVCGKGTDCLGLIRGVWRSVVGAEPVDIPSYSVDWGEVEGEETMITAAQRWFVPSDLEHEKPGDVVLFRWRNAAIVKHAGILSGNGRFIHAYEKAGVVETSLVHQWHRRIVATFSFPNL